MATIKRETPKRTASATPLYATVCLMNGHRCYGSFSRDLPKLIAYAERNRGVIVIDEAHAGKPPVWTRPTDDE